MNAIVPGYVMVKLSSARAAGLEAGAMRAPVVISDAVFQTRIADSGWTLWQIPTIYDPRVVAASIKRQSGVLSAQPLNRIYPLLVQPNDPDYGVTESAQTNPEMVLVLNSEANPSFRRLWHLDDTNAEAAWQVYPNNWFTSSTKQIRSPLIAIIDTGCDTGHPDFANAGSTETNAALGGQIELAKSAQFRLGARKLSNVDFQDANGHGTHVAGLAVAAGNNGGFEGHGVIGTGFNSKAMICRVFDENDSGTDADASAAIYYAANKGADIISLSLGTTNYSQIFQDAVTYAWQKGCLVIAAGNENGNGGGNLGPIYPAACSGALGVSANGPNGQPAVGTYSGYGPYVDVAAPGGDIVQDPDYFLLQYVFSTAVRGVSSLSSDANMYPPYTPRYSYLIGTSMATPQVSGAAGLFYGYKKLRRTIGWSNVRAYKAIEKSAAMVMGAPYGGWEPVQGYGCLDMWSMLMEANSRGAQVGGVEGIVYYNGTPVQNAAVKAQRPSGGVIYSTTTMADGTYRFEGMPKGVYKVWSAPFGQTRTKKVNIEIGCDMPGFDFWCGTVTGDDTPPSVQYFITKKLVAGALVLNQWCYDTETGIDKFEVQVGTTPGGANILAKTEVVLKAATAKVTGLATTPGTTYYVTGTYTNGNGTATTATATIVAQ